MNPFNLIKFVPLPVLRAVALCSAYIVNKVPTVSIKRSIDINLRLAYPKFSEAERQEYALQIVRNQFLSAVESIKCWAMPPQWSMEQIHNVYNQEVLEQALESSSGMLAIVPHLGTWEMMNAWLNQFGAPTIMYKPVKNKLQNEFILQGRQKLHANLVPTDSSGVKAIFKTLKSGGFSIILPDHVPRPSGGVNAPFFGIKTLTSTLTPKLASKTHCAMVGLICVRSNNDHTLTSGFDIHCIALDDPKLYSKDTLVATSALNKNMETMINRFPKHYMWGYKRFKNIPIINNPYKTSKEKLTKFINTYVSL